MTLTELFTNIANAIRSKKGTSDKINATDFAKEIENIQTGGGDISEYFTEKIGKGDSTSISGFMKTIKKVPMYTIKHDDATYMFANLLLTEIPQLDTSNVTEMFGMFHSAKKLTTIPQLNTSNVTDMSLMFYYCTALKEIPLLDTSNVKDMASMFAFCSALTEIPLLDTSNVTNMQIMFNGCTALKEIPLLDTSNVTNMQQTFQNCVLITEIPQLDTSKVKNMNGTFNSCKALTTIPLLDLSSVSNNVAGIVSSCTNLTNLGGFLNLGKSYTVQKNNYSYYTLSLTSCNKLTHDSLMNVINNLYDLNLTYDVANGGTLYTQQLQLGSTNLAKLTAEEISLCTSKGWSIS